MMAGSRAAIRTQIWESPVSMEEQQDKDNGFGDIVELTFKPGCCAWTVIHIREVNLLCFLKNIYAQTWRKTKTI